jgi:hypothetical protein
VSEAIEQHGVLASNNIIQSESTAWPPHPDTIHSAHYPNTAEKALETPIAAPTCALLSGTSLAPFLGFPSQRPHGAWMVPVSVSTLGCPHATLSPPPYLTPIGPCFLSMSSTQLDPCPGPQPLHVSRMHSGNSPCLCQVPLCTCGLAFPQVCVISTTSHNASLINSMGTSYPPTALRWANYHQAPPFTEEENEALRASDFLRSQSWHRSGLICALNHPPHPHDFTSGLL